MRQRRDFLLGMASMGLVAGCQGGPEAARPATSTAVAPGAGPVRLVYLSAWNCPTCPGFDAAHVTPYERSAAARRVPVVRVSVPNLQAPFTANSYWPADLQWLRAEHAARGVRGAPWTMLIKGDTTLVSAWGTSGYLSNVEPRLQRELAAT